MSDVRVVSARGTVTASRALRPTTADRRDVLTRAEARGVVRELYGESSDRPTLLALYALAMGDEPYLSARMRDADFISAIDAAIDSGQLVFTDGWSTARFSGRGPAPEDTAATALAKELMAGRDEILFEGQRYSLVAESAATRRERREGYRLVEATLAANLVQRMAGRIARTPKQQSRWAEAVLMVRDPSEGRSLSLLLYSPAGGIPDAPDDDDPAVTPSQLNTTDTHWIEVAIVYDDGTPYEGNCVLTLPGGRSTGGPPGDGGTVRMDGLTAGDCKLQLPDLDAAAFKLS